MKKAFLIIMVLCFGVSSWSLPVKLTKKILKDGSAAYSCELLTGNVNYKLAFKVTEKGQHKFISGIGLLGGTKRYSKRGWWSGFNGFFKLKVWGRDLAKMPVTFAVNDDGIVFDFNDMKIIFKARENDDKLGMNIKFSKAPQNGKIQFTCYPGNMFKNNPEKRSRLIHTAKRQIPGNDKTKPLKLGKDESWLYYMDVKFDPGKHGHYFSTCALVYNPAEVSSAYLVPGTYSIWTNLVLSDKVKDYSFVLWEFPGRKSAKCLEAMKKLKVNFK
jgi:hypothetical protein